MEKTEHLTMKKNKDGKTICIKCGSVLWEAGICNYRETKGIERIMLDKDGDLQWIPEIYITSEEGDITCRNCGAHLCAWNDDVAKRILLEGTDIK